MYLAWKVVCLYKKVSDLVALLFKLLIQQLFNEHSCEPTPVLGAQDSLMNKRQNEPLSGSHLREQKSQNIGSI